MVKMSVDIVIGKVSRCKMHRIGSQFVCLEKPVVRKHGSESLKKSIETYTYANFYIRRNF